MRRLREFDVVSISLPTDVASRSTFFRCHLLAVISGTAALEAVQHTDALGLPERVDGAMLTFRHARNLVGLRGMLWSKEPLGDLRFSVGDGVQQTGRLSTRIELRTRISFQGAAGAGHVEGTTVNISADGILAETTLEAPVGEAVEVSLWLPGTDAPLTASATIVRRGDGLLAVNLGADAVAARTQLARFVLEHNRSLVRRAGGGAARFDF